MTRLKRSIKKTIFYANDDYESVTTLLQLRGPALIIGLFLGISISFITSKFEVVLTNNVQVAFFLPFIIYIADAVGNQTETIYSSNLKSGKTKFENYFYKESILGLVFGLIFGILAGIISWLWLSNNLLSISVGLATTITVSTAPLIALFVTQIFQSMGKDPAVGSGPIDQVVQNMVSVIIYGIVTSLIML